MTSHHSKLSRRSLLKVTGAISLQTAASAMPISAVYAQSSQDQSDPPSKLYLPFVTQNSSVSTEQDENQVRFEKARKLVSASESVVTTLSSYAAQGFKPDLEQAQLIWDDDAIDLIGFRFQQTSKVRPESVLIVNISVDLAVEQVTAIDAHVLSMKDDVIEISETLVFPTTHEQRKNNVVLSQANPSEKGMSLTITKYKGSEVEVLARNQQVDLPDDMAKALGCNPCSSLGTQFMGNPKEVTNCVT